MRMAAELLRILFFPGLLFMAACGLLFLFLEDGLARAVGGGESRTRRSLGVRGVLSAVPAPGDVASSLAAAAAMGVAGMLLVRVEGDLFSLVILLSVPGLLPLMATALGEGEGAARIPLLFRGAAARLFALACIAAASGLRYPGEFTPGLKGFIDEGVFGAARAWSGTGSILVLSSQVLVAASFFLALLGHPSIAALTRRGAEGAPGTALAALAEGAERAVSMLLFAVICLGYPWRGTGGTVYWGACGLGMAAAATAARAWLEGRNAVFRRRVLTAAPVLAALSLALAAAAAVIGG